jgi:hypothetical protein
MRLMENPTATLKKSRRLLQGTTIRISLNQSMCRRMFLTKRKMKAEIQWI